MVEIRRLGAATGAGNILANAGSDLDNVPRDLTPLATGAIAHVGGGQAHDNMQPYLAVTFCIAVQGIYPSRN